LSDKPEENLRRREERYDRERRIRLKVGEDLETMEEVFDGRTLMTVMHLLNTGRLTELQGAMKSGKESRIYHGIDPKGNELAVKIYLTSSSIFRQGRLKYIRGDPRFKDVPHDTRSLVDQWAMKEFKNLQLAKEAELAVPRPIYVEKNVLLMEFIGKNGVPAPHLREVPLQAASSWYEKILEMLKDLYDKAKLVHGDVSEYNILVPDGYPMLIDFAQAVTIEHPEAREFLKRDIENLNNYFKGLNVRTRSFERIFKMEK
jgi:RIO kinase 1